MVAVKEFTWEEISAPDFETRQAWRAAVAEVAAKAKATLPECNGRVDSALKIVLAGDVELLPDGRAKVASQSNGQTAYHIVNGSCDCKDYPKAPSNWCKHRISAGIAKRATALAKATLEQRDGVSTGQAETPSPPTPAQPAAALPLATQADIDQCVHERVRDVLATMQPALPEAPASCNCYVSLAGRQVQLTLRDRDEGRLLARLEAILQCFPVEAPAPSATPTLPAIPRCTVHGGLMKASTKKPNSFYCSHKLPDSSFCTSKA